MRRMPGLLALASFLAAAFVFVLALPAVAGEIHRAAAAGEADVVARLVREDPSLANAPDPDHQFANRPLHYAAEAGHVEVARVLLDAGAPIDCFDSDESTPLDDAALHRRLEMVDFLLSRGADVNRRDKNGAYALSFAAAGGDTSIVRRVLEAGADLNFRDKNGVTLLHLAVGRNMRFLFDHMIEHGADVNAATGEGETPLHFAASRGRVELVQALLEKGANASLADTSGTPPLIVSIWGGRPEILRMLLDAGADPNGANHWGLSPISLAARSGNAEMARLLAERGADVDFVGREGERPLHLATARGSVETVEAILAFGPSLDPVEERWGYTPLHAAAVRGFASIAEKLLRAGANPSARDAAGATASELAARYGNEGVLAALAAAGAPDAGIEAHRECAADFRKLGDREAVVWYTGHSGFAVKTKKNFLVFDYWPGEQLPDQPGICNGNIAPDEVRDERMTVFVSHDHRDHLSPAIYEWNGAVKDLAYVFGCRAEGDGVPPYEQMEPRQTRKVHGVKITTIRSTDSGVGFLVEADGMTIFHAGDHANGMCSGVCSFRDEIDWLAAKGVRPDILMMPIRGCGLGDPDSVKAGVDYAIETLRPFAFVPMHAVDAENTLREFVEERADRFPETRMYSPEHRGDRFRYEKGKIS